MLCLNIIHVETENSQTTEYIVDEILLRVGLKNDKVTGACNIVGQ